MVGSAPTFERLVTLPTYTKPVPVLAEFSLVNRTYRVHFDQPLVGGIVDYLNWGGRADGIVRYPTQALVIGPTVFVDTTTGPLKPGNFVSYSPPPFDVVAAASGLAADAFSRFPVVLV